MTVFLFVIVNIFEAYGLSVFATVFVISQSDCVVFATA